MLTVKVKLVGSMPAEAAHVVLDQVIAVLDMGDRCSVWLTGGDESYLVVACTAEEFLERATEVQRTADQLKHARQVRMRCATRGHQP